MEARPNESKPAPIGKPLVWADVSIPLQIFHTIFSNILQKRQGLCETLPYYNAYQSGAYIHKGLLYGFLLAQNNASRCLIDDEIVITRG